MADVSTESSASDSADRHSKLDSSSASVDRSHILDQGASLVKKDPAIGLRHEVYSPSGSESRTVADSSVPKKDAVKEQKSSLSIEPIDNILAQSGKTAQSFDAAQKALGASDKSSFSPEQEKPITDALAKFKEADQQVVLALHQQQLSKTILMATLTPEQRTAFEQAIPKISRIKQSINSSLESMGPDAQYFAPVLILKTTKAGDPNHDQASAFLTEHHIDPDKYINDHSDVYQLWSDRARVLINAKLPDGFYDRAVAVNSNISKLHRVHSGRIEAEVIYAGDLLQLRHDQDGAKSVVEDAMSVASAEDKAEVNLRYPFVDSLLHPLIPTGVPTADANPRVNEFAKLSFEDIAARGTSLSATASLKLNESVKKEQDLVAAKEKQEISVYGATPSHADFMSDRAKLQSDKYAELTDLNKAAILKADAIDQKSVNKKIEDLQSELESGKTVDTVSGLARTLTADERVQRHAQVLQLIQASERPMISRDNLASMYISRGLETYEDDPKAAGADYLLAAKEVAGCMDKISKLPIELIKKEGELLQKDINDSAVSKVGFDLGGVSGQPAIFALKENYDELKTLPLNLSQSAADFMVSGGRNADGTTAGFAGSHTLREYVDLLLKYGKISQKDLSSKHSVEKIESRYADMKASYTVLDAATAWKYRDTYVDLNKRLNDSDLSSADNPTEAAASLRNLDQLIAKSAPEGVRGRLNELSKNADTMDVAALQSQLLALAGTTQDLSVRAQLGQLAQNIKDQTDRRAALMSLDTTIQENYPEQLRKELSKASTGSQTMLAEGIAMVGAFAGAVLVSRFVPAARIGMAAKIGMAPLGKLAIGESEVLGNVGTRVMQAGTGLASGYAADFGFRRGVLGQSSADVSNKYIMTESATSVASAFFALGISRGVYNRIKGANLPLDNLAPYATKKIAGILGRDGIEPGAAGMGSESITAKDMLNVVAGNKDLKAAAKLLSGKGGYEGLSLSKIEQLEKGKAELFATKPRAWKVEIPGAVGESAETKALAQLKDAGVSFEKTPAELEKPFSGVKSSALDRPIAGANIQTPELKELSQILPTTPIAQIKPALADIETLGEQKLAGSIRENLQDQQSLRKLNESAQQVIDGEKVSDKSISEVRQVYLDNGYSKEVAYLDRMTAEIGGTPATKFSDTLAHANSQFVANDSQLTALERMSQNPDIAGKTIDEARATLSKGSELLPNILGVTDRTKMSVVQQLGHMQMPVKGGLFRSTGRWFYGAARPFSPLSENASGAEILGSKFWFGVAATGAWSLSDRYNQAVWNNEHSGSSQSPFGQVSDSIVNQANQFQPTQIFGAGFGLAWNAANLFNSIGTESPAGMRQVEGSLVRKSIARIDNMLNPGEVRGLGSYAGQLLYWPVVANAPFIALQYWREQGARQRWNSAIENSERTHEALSHP